ncbi:hypothetical protein KKI23_03000 [Patescibacteria group bacterium]|nr:hypothetical protein [Patescibacteria group bacterium]
MALKWYSALIFILLVAMAISNLLELFDGFTAPMWHNIAVLVLSVVGLFLAATTKKSVEATPPPQQ